MDHPRTLSHSPTDRVPDRAVAHAAALMDLAVWVGSPSAQEAVDEALGLVIAAVIGPLREPSPEPPGWMLGATGRADLASVRATVGRLHRTAEALDGGAGTDPVARAARGLAVALSEFDELTEISLRHRAASPRGDGPGAHPIGALRAAKRLTAACREATSALTAPTSD
ncbi:hypothetical protein [Kytococcus sedentarius]|uniref:hypothetical protein n=1 Tax=Kytococcus sedentarius TaxID=1276 RepID=UPI0035BBDB60